jgi:hypothetical protein
MSQPLNLKELERKAYRSFFGDGIWDLSIGILLLALGVGAAIARLGITWGYVIPDLHVITLSLYVVSMAVLVVGKRYITVPRLGRVRFGAGRRRRLSSSALILLVSALLGAIVFLLVGGKGVPESWRNAVPTGLLLFAANALIVWGLLAYFLDFRRLYGYAVLWALAFPASEAVAAHTALSRASSFLLTVGAFAGVMLVTGIVLLIRFLRDYPIATEPAMENNG